MTDDPTDKRLEDVEDHIRQDLKLLKDYEDELRYETDTRKMARFKREIERQRKSLALYWKEYEELKNQAAPAQIQNVADLLQQKEAKLDAVQNLINMQQPRIFISYARSDGEEFARNLRRRLIEEYHLAIWQDRTSMEGGKDWWQQIEEALRSKHVEYLVLVMTPNALRSDTVRKEWRLARSLGVCVEPVIASKGLDFQSMPQWMRAVHFVDPDVPEQWDRFILSLKSPCQVQRVPFMVEDLPEDFVERPGEFDQLITNLLENKRDEPVAITAALRGAGGYGKTTLARALCHDGRVQEAFYDGILWVTLGKEPGDLIDKVNDLIEILSGERPGFKSIESAANHLTELLASRRMLIVIDDVWNVAHLRPFLQGGTQCARLITTRNFDTLPANARRIDVDAMKPKEAEVLLSSGLPQGNETDLNKLAARLGEWPLLLKLVNGALLHRVSITGQTLADALAYVNRALDKRGLTFFDASNEAARESAVAKTLGVSLDLLGSEERARYNELAIFPEDVDIPLSVLETLWGKTGGFDDFDTEALCDRLGKLSLLMRFDPVTRYIRLHDVVRQYLIYEQRKELPALHNQLLDAYRSLLPQQPQSQFTDWAALPANESYLWNNLANHLVEARRGEELRRLLFDVAYMHAKLYAVDVNALIRDYDFLSSDRTVDCVQNAIRLSAHILARDKTQLRSQVYGRLLGKQDAPEIKTLLDRIKEWRDGPWLCPINPSLTPPGGALIRTLEGHIGPVSAIAVLPDGKRAVSGSDDRKLKVWDMETGELIRTLEGHTGAVSAVAVLPDGKRAVSGSDDRKLKVWDMETGELIRTLEGHTGAVSAVAVMPDGKRAVSGSYDRKLKVWDMETGEVIQTLEGHTSWVSAVAVMSDGKRVVSGSDDLTLKVWDLETGEVIQTLVGHSYLVSAVAVMPDGKRAVSGSDDTTLKVWDLETGEDSKGRTGWVMAVAVTSDGNRAVSGHSETTALKVWDRETGELIRTLEGHTSWVSAVAVLPDGKRAVSGSTDGTLKVWDMETGKVIQTLEGHTGGVHAVAVMPNGKRAVSGSTDGTLKVWDLETGKVIQTLEGHTGTVHAVAVMPDGKRAVSGSNETTLKVWDMETGELIRMLEGHTGAVSALAVMPDGKRAVSGSDDRKLKVWDMETGKVIQTLEGHTGGVNAVAVMPDGKRAVSGSHDTTLKVWDMETGEVIISFSGDGSFISIAVSQDEKTIVAGEASGKVHFLRLIETRMIPEIRTEQKITCPRCHSDDVTFSKKKQLYVCPDCRHEFIVEK
jgi:WD40 repeat protein